MRRIACVALRLVRSRGLRAPRLRHVRHDARRSTITGTVTKLAFVNPHSWLYLDVTGADGKRVPMRCEMRSATTLRRSGWTPEMFTRGEQVTITGSPDRNDAERRATSATLVFADGSSLDRYGQRTPPVGRRTAAARRRGSRTGDPNIAGAWAAGTARHGRSARRERRARAAQRGAGGRRLTPRPPRRTGVRAAVLARGCLAAFHRRACR